MMIPELSENDLKKLILYSDEDILAINKPAGVLTVPGGFSPNTPDVKQLFSRLYPSLWMVHRLDKDTSGVLLLARNAPAHRSMNLEFDQRVIRKEYLALVVGSPDWQEFHLDQPLLVNGDRAHRTICTFSGKPASTDFHVLQRSDQITLLSVEPHTGLTHQIRAHLAFLGFPILQDALYGKSAIRPEHAIIHRTALHALKITFTHPSSNNQITVQAPYPEDFRSALTILTGGK
jgi:tRNA pseudouridine32 synthase / 23S rRNA pseudouridine746 synthase